MVALYRERFEHYGHGPAKKAIVGLGGQVFMRKNSQDAIREFRPYFDNAPVYGNGPSLEDFMRQTPLTVGSPQEVIDRTLGFREVVGDYQRQLFLIDHAGLPLRAVLEQIDFLGEIVPVLRREFDAMRDPEVPSEPPTHASLLAARDGAGASDEMSRELARAQGVRESLRLGESPDAPAAPAPARRRTEAGEAFGNADAFGVRIASKEDSVTGASFYEQQESEEAAVSHADQLLKDLA